MNILVTGANGQLGHEIRSRVEAKGNGHPDHDTSEKNYYIFATREDLDISNEEEVRKYIHDNKINIVVNCAAYTDVEKAQKERTSAYDVNALGPMNLANALNESGGVLIHVSTDYVFGGSRNTPVPPVPVGADVLNYPDMDRDDCFYGYSKNIGESLIGQVQGARYIIIRTSWLYSSEGKNFVKTMADRALHNKETKVVFDQTGSPTYAGDLAEFILHIIEDTNAETRYLSKTGVYNFSNKGAATWYDLAYSVFSSVLGSENAGKILSPCRSSEFPSDVVRPTYSVLDVSKTEDTFNYNIRYWQIPVSDVVLDITRQLITKEAENRARLELENTEFDYGHNVSRNEKGPDNIVELMTV